MKPARVLFVCLGNAIRSQMAEAFARHYGGDVIRPASAGLAPATMIAPLAREVMAGRNISLDDQFPKGLDEVEVAAFDLVVNLSGRPLRTAGPRRDWKVRDPVGGTEAQYREAADEIERLVMGLILELRAATSQSRS